MDSIFFKDRGLKNAMRTSKGNHALTLIVSRAMKRSPLDPKIFNIFKGPLPSATFI